MQVNLSIFKIMQWQRHICLTWKYHNIFWQFYSKRYFCASLEVSSWEGTMYCSTKLRKN